MRILRGEMLRDAPPVIPIHHGFQGANPYHQAYARGVERIGATAHHATEVLDQRAADEPSRRALTERRRGDRGSRPRSIRRSRSRAA